MVEQRVVALGQGCEVRKQSSGVDVVRCAAHEPVGLLYHSSHIQVVTVVEKILQERDYETVSKGWGGDTVKVCSGDI